MWNAIANVSSAITLIAFLAAILASVYRRHVLQKERMVKMVPQEQRGPLVESLLNRVSVDTKGLTREQRYDLVVRLIENRARKFTLLTRWIGLVASLAAIVAALTFRQVLNDARERALTGFPPPFPFHTGWIFLGYHDSWRWLEGPMATIALRSEGGRTPPKTKGGRPISRAEEIFHDLSHPTIDPTTRRHEYQIYSQDVFYPIEDLIRYQHNIEESSTDSIPAIGDILRISKVRRIVIADFRTKGLANQMSFPPLVKNVITDDDETGLQLDPGALVVVRDVQLGAYPGRAAAVWCRVAACEPGIPQCECALEEARKDR